MKKRKIHEEIQRNVETIRKNFDRLRRSTEEGAQKIHDADAKFEKVTERADRHLDRLRRDEDEDTGRIEVPIKR